MTLKPITKQGDCFYIGEHLIAVHHKSAMTIVHLSSSQSSVCKSQYIGNVGELTLERFEKEFFYQHYLFFCKIKEEYFLCGSTNNWDNNEIPSFGIADMFDMTEEESNYYYVYDEKITRGKANIYFTKSSKKDYEVIEIEEETKRWGVNLFADEHYLFKVMYRWNSNVELLRESKKAMSADYHYMISDNYIFRVMHYLIEIGYKKKEHPVMTPQRIYPYFPRVTSKTRVERCEDIDNIYRLLDSADESNNALGKILLKQFHKQTKK